MSIFEIVLGVLSLLMTAFFGFPVVIDWLEKNKNKKSEVKPNERKEINKLRIGCIPFPPFINYESVDGKIIINGLFYELFEELSKAKNIKIEYIPIQNEDSIHLLKTGKIDLVCCLFKTIQRARIMDFSSCFYSVSVGGVIRSDDDRIKVISDLTKDEIKVAVVKGEVGAEIAKDVFGITKIDRRLIEVETHDVGSIISMVSSGMVDIAITDNMTCRQFILENVLLSKKLQHVFIADPLYLGQIGLMINIDDSDLRDFLEKELKELRYNHKIFDSESKIINDFDGTISSIFPHAPKL